MLRYLNQITNYKRHWVEENFFRPRWYSIFLNPYFIDRSALYHHIKKFARTTKAKAKILDVGCGNKPYQGLFSSHDYTGIDVQGGGHDDTEKTVDKYFDGTNIPYPDKHFDVVICTQVLEHSVEPEKLTQEISRILKDDGRVFISIPFVWNEHEAPYDFRRLTRYGLIKLLSQADLKIKQLDPDTGIFGVLGQMLSAFIFESLNFRSTIIKTALAMTILGPIQLLALGLDKLTGRRWITLDYIIIATKQ